MVEKDFIEKLQQVCDSFEKSKGAVNLFAALKMDELTEKWTIVISADWVDDNNFEDIFVELRELLMNSLKDEMTTIARIGIFDLTNHFSELMVRRFVSGDSIDSDEQINGNLVHEGYIIKAVKPDKSKTKP